MSPVYHTNMSGLNLWSIVQRRFESIGLGFLPLGVMKALFISVAILVLLPLCILGLAALLAVVAIFIVLAILYFLIKLPFRVLGLLLGVGSRPKAPFQPSAQPDDDGRRNVRVIPRIEDQT